MQNNFIRPLLKLRSVSIRTYKYRLNICTHKPIVDEKNTVRIINWTNNDRTLANKAFYSNKGVIMDLEEFDYVVTYPKLNQNDSENREVKVDTKIPVVILFGWVNCKDKHLAKYAKMYGDNGMITLRYCLPNRYMFFEPNKTLIIGQKMANLICELQIEEHPIFVHNFSNGGTTVYLNMSKALEHTPKSINIKGIIFDSTPGSRSVIGLYRVISEIYKEQKLYFAKPRAFAHATSVAALWTWEKIYNVVNPKENDGYLEVRRYLQNEKYRWPQHYIYSSIDNIVNASGIKEFIEIRKKMGIEVSSLCFNDSPHVSHYLYHKEEYTESVLDFIDKCINISQDTVIPENSKLTSKL